MTVYLAQPSASLKPAAQNRSALHRVFQTLEADSCPRSYNFHMHTIYSDGKLSPEELMEQAMSIGLKGLAITDHHSVGGYYVAQNWLDRCSDDNPRFTRADRSDSPSFHTPKLWTGVEINASVLDTEVHILGYAFDPEHPKMQPYLQGHPVKGKDYQADRAISAIQNAGGLAVLAHPARYHKRSPAELIPEVARLGIDGVETFYAYANPNPWHPSPKQTAQVKQLGSQYDLLHTCGTDTHGSNLLMRL